VKKYPKLVHRNREAIEMQVIQRVVALLFYKI